MTNPSRKRVVTSDDLDTLNRNSAYARQQGDAAQTAAATATTAGQAAQEATAHLTDVVTGAAQSAAAQATAATEGRVAQVITDATAAKNAAAAAALNANTAASAASTTIAGLGYTDTAQGVSVQLGAPLATAGKWLFSESAGTTATDSSGKNHPSTLKGAAVFGASGIALTGGRVDLGPSFSPTPTGRYVLLAATVGTSNGYATVLGKMDTGNGFPGEWFLRVSGAQTAFYGRNGADQSGGVVVGLYGGDLDGVSLIGTHYIEVMLRPDGQWIVAVDGTETVVSTGRTLPAATSQPLTVGADAAGAQPAPMTAHGLIVRDDIPSLTERKQLWATLRAGHPDVGLPDPGVQPPGATPGLARQADLLAVQAAVSGSLSSDQGSLIDGDLTSPLWTATYPGRAPTVRAQAASDSGYLDAVAINEDSNAPTDGSLWGYVGVPPGATTLTATWRLRGSGTVRLAVTDRFAHVLASRDVVLTGNMTEYAVTGNVPGGHAEALVNLQVNVSGQASVLAGRPRVISNSDQGVFGDSYERYDLGPHWLMDSVWEREVRTPRGYYTNSFSRAVFDTTAEQVALEFYSDIIGTAHGVGGAKVGILLNGRPYATVGASADDTVTTKLLTLPKGLKQVEVRSGGQQLADKPRGTFLRALYASSAAMTRRADEERARRLLCYTDSIGQGIGGEDWPVQGWVMQVRSRFPGAVVSYGNGSRQLWHDIGDGGEKPKFLTRVSRSRATDIWTAMGANDFGNGRSTADFAALYATYLDEVHARLPGAVIWCQSLTLWPSQEGQANAGGATPADYRAAVQAACSSRPWTRYVDGAAILTASDLSDGLHPSTAAQAKYAAFVLGTI